MCFYYPPYLSEKCRERENIMFSFFQYFFLFYQFTNWIENKEIQSNFHFSLLNASIFNVGVEEKGIGREKEGVRDGGKESVGKWPRSKCEKFICESKMVINIYLSFCFICLDYGQKILNGIKKKKKTESQSIGK